ncbi:Dipeptidyl carboxypeptidase Dcp [Acidisarcina polymorpha]|uniref:Dipeptidyl carboxypeptidase n=1 Tax=Acidisarcina polymorpha TaxID=2211140 RepID=A0A2Z5G5U6_9BACT|nr:Dipeptidyl carboxypeptidase Dcp [Acidisarcina polymorpha]
MPKGRFGEIRRRNYSGLRVLCGQAFYFNQADDRLAVEDRRNMNFPRWITLIPMSISFIAVAANPPATPFDQGNPFYAPSTLPFQAPPFDKIKDSDYQPAIEAGIAEQLKEMHAIANDSAAPTFDNTLVAMEKAGQLLQRVLPVFEGVSGANTNPALQKIEEEETPKLAALHDSIYLDAKLFERVSAIYRQRDSLKLDPESKRLVEKYYQDFVHAGANLSDEKKAELKKLNEEGAKLSNDFKNKLLAATKAGAYATTDKENLAGLSDAQIASAAQAAKSRNQDGWVIPLQNTTQQPALTQLSNGATRNALFENSWERAERGGENDTRDTIARLAQLRARKAELLGYPNFAAWKLEDQMAKTPEAALKFMNDLVPAATAKAAREARDIQALIASQRGDAGEGAFHLHPWDWNFYAEQVRKARYDLDESQVKPYFELNNVLQNGVFYAANQLYGITFKERHDLPVYQPDVRVFEVYEADGKPLALFYCDYYKRDNKNGGAWMSSFVDQSKLLGTLPVVYNVANLPKPAEGQPALISFSDVTTMFHEFGHALHGMFAASQYPTLSGTSVARDFVEFPSQFNEHWATYPAVFDHFAKDYKTGAPIPPELTAKIKKAATFNQGYALTELLAAAELDMQWHTLPVTAPLQKPDAFEQEALEKTKLLLSYVPPRYRSSYFSHIWGGGYAAGYYAYLWAEMLDDDAFQWFQDHGGLTRANGDRFRQMVLSRGNTEDLAKMYEAWLGSAPNIQPMLKFRGLDQP